MIVKELRLQPSLCYNGCNRSSRVARASWLTLNHRRCTMTSSLPRLTINGRSTPPEWAIKQRYLINLMDRSAQGFVDKYTQADGSLIWRNQWPGMDGSDDAYESF